MWVAVWPAAPFPLLCGHGGVHAPASAQSTPTAERPGPLCPGPAVWPEHTNAEMIQ